MNVFIKPLVDPQENLLPLLHVNLGIVKYFIKAMDKSGDFRFLKRKFPKLSEAKIMEGVLEEPQIR